MVDIPKAVQPWLSSSEEEWEVANTLAKNTYFAQAHFHMHLSLEKLVKALVVSHTSAHAPFSQNLSFLAGKTNSTPSEEHLLWLGAITDFNLSGRYREEKQLLQRDLGEGSWTQWCQRGEVLRQWLLKQFP